MHPLERQVVMALALGHEEGDRFCTLLLEEYDEIADIEETRNKFIETIANKRSSIGYKEWLLIHKNLFYDDRFYTII
jgi:hypothetical protein